jgi:hypothetical protein
LDEKPQNCCRKHLDVYVAYSPGLKGLVIGEEDAYDAALADVKSAIQFHLETLGPGALDPDSIWDFQRGLSKGIRGIVASWGGEAPSPTLF